MAQDKTLRPADEVARAMAVSRMTSWITGKTVVGLTIGGSRVHVEVDSEGEADDLRRLLARLIEQSRAEGAEAERADGIVKGLWKARSIVFAFVGGELKDELYREIDEAIDEAERGEKP